MTRKRSSGASATRSWRGPGSPTLRYGPVWQAHEDWAETWKRGLAPRRITDRLVVRPSWTDFEAGPEDLVIVLDPGMAFGTAEHGTTRGCLRLLDHAVTPGDRLLDVDKIDAFIALMSPLGLIEVSRTGAAAIACGAETLAAAPQPQGD